MTRIHCLVSPDLDKVTGITMDAGGRKILRRHPPVLLAQALRLTIAAVTVPTSQLITARM